MNMAGIGGAANLIDMKFETFDRVIKINLYAYGAVFPQTEGEDESTPTTLPADCGTICKVKLQ
jgi:NAD(P)-dependent dehydrogenase (short-subunit alcohol dehydrogenase family)